MSITFAVGHGRVGSMSLARTFNVLPETIGVHEPAPPLLNETRERMRGAGGEWISNSLLVSRGGPIRRARHYLEATHWFCWLIDDIVRAWPDAKIIWLVRDMDAWLRSAWRRGWYQRLAEGRRAWAPYIRPVPPEGEWPHGVDRWFKLGYLWQSIELQMDFVSERYSTDQMTTFLTEDLNDRGALTWLAEWAGLPELPFELRHDNKGSEAITMEDLSDHGVDLALFGIVDPDRETLEDIVVVKEVERLGINLEGLVPRVIDLGPHRDMIADGMDWAHVCAK